MIDCLPATGAEPPLAWGIALALIGAGVGAVLWSARRRRRDAARSTVSRAALATLLVLLLGTGALVSGAPPATADAGCPPTASPTATPVPTATFTAPTIGPDQEISFDSGGVTTFGSYRAPLDTSRPVAAAVIIGGTGAVDRDGNAPTVATEAYAWLADLLSAQGIASVRYDKLGTGKTGLGPYAADPAAMLPLSYETLRLQPARDALTFLAAQPGIDTSRLLIVGHSEGGAAALTIAGDLRGAPAPAGLALVEPAYTHILDILSRQFQSQMDAAAAGGAMKTEDAQTLTQWMTDGVEQIRTGTPPFPDPGGVPLPDATDFTQVIQAAIASNVYGADPAQMVITHAYRTLYGQGYDAIDPAVIAPAISIPTLITCGTKDFNTPCGDGSAGSGVIALDAEFAPGVTRFVELPDMVHILRDVGDANVPSIVDQVGYPFSALMAEEFSAFVARFATVPAP